jgi:Rieske Fe-S protein
LEPRRRQPHATGLSFWPWGLAFGVLLLLGGIAINWIAAAVGAVITLLCGFFFVRTLTRSHQLVEQEEAEERSEREREDEERVEIPSTPRYGRAAFLGLTTIGLSQVIGGLITLPVLGFMVMPSFLKQGFKDVDLGKMTLYPEGKWIVATFVENPEQGAVTRKTAFVRNNGFLGNLPSFTILSNHCAHLGCPVQPSGVLSTKTIDFENVTLIPMETPPSGFGCPCHGGQYDTEGNRTAGPPVRSLDRYSFSIRNGNLFLGTPFSVAHVEGTGANAKITKTALSFPGEHVDGVESWLYPIQPPH